jgi:hypothetical protein
VLTLARCVDSDKRLAPWLTGTCGGAACVRNLERRAPVITTFRNGCRVRLPHLSGGEKRAQRFPPPALGAWGLRAAHSPCNNVPFDCDGPRGHRMAQHDTAPRYFARRWTTIVGRRTTEAAVLRRCCPGTRGCPGVRLTAPYSCEGGRACTICQPPGNSHISAGVS